VSWCFNSRDALAAQEPDYFFNKPSDFLLLIGEI
jgi:hypothetical protein